MSPRVRRARMTTAVRYALGGCALALTSTSLAQTWVNPNSGSWSDVANWVDAVSPNSLNGTQLTFSVATGETYTTTNDIADPFTLNTIHFNAQDGGTINLGGGQLLFDGISPIINNAGSGAVYISNAIQIASTGTNTDALTITGAGTGSINMAGTLSSSITPTATGGGAINLHAASTTLRMSGGGTLFAIRGSAGTIALDGGTWNLTSTQRRFDALLGVDDGPWALSLGEVANQQTNFEMNGGTLTAPQAFVAAVPNSISTATFTNGAHADISGSLGRFGVNAGSGTINVLNGAHVITRFFEHGRQDGSTAVGLVDGAGSRIDCTNFVVARGPLCHGTMTISNGGVIAVNGNTYLSYLSPQESFNGSAFLSVDGTGSQLALTGDIYCGLASNATLSVSNNGSVTAHNIFMGYQNPDEAGTILVQGGSLISSGQLLMRSTTTQNFIQVTAGTFEMNGAGGGSFVNALVGAGFGGNSHIDINGPDARFLQTGASTFMIVSGGIDTYAPVSTISIGNGGLMQVGNGGMFLCSAEAAHATISVSGTNSRLTVGGAGSGDLIAAQAGTDTFEVGSVATLTASSGGAIEVGGSALFSPVTGARSSCVVDAGTFTVGGQLHLGGASGGTATLDVTNGGFVSSNGASAVYSNATLTVGSGAMFLNGSSMSVDGHVFNGGSMQVGTGGMYLATTGAAAAFATVSGAQSHLAISGDVVVGQAGNATLAISSGGLVEAAGNAFTSPSAGANSACSVDGGTWTVGGQLHLGGAGGIDGGTATLGVTNGGFVSSNGASAVYSNATLTVGGGVSPAKFVSGGSTTVDGHVFNSGSMQVGTDGMYLATSASRIAVVNVSGNQSQLAIGGAGTGDLVVAQAGIATLAISAGGSVDVAGDAFTSPSAGANSACSVDGGTWTVGGQLHLGGAGGIDGGTATLDVSNGGFVSSGGSTAVYSNATLTVGSGLVPATFVSGGGLSVDGQVFYNSGTLKVAGELAVGTSVVLSDAARDIGGTPQNKKVLEAGSVTFTTSGFIDLNDNDAIIHNNTLSEVENFVRTGRNGGLWNGTMLVSTAAKNLPSQATNLGVITGADFHSAAGGTALFNGREVAETDVLVKYTYNGDTDFDGKVSGADYARIDTTFNNEESTQTDIGGWFNGDFDLNGKVDGADYAMIDSGFNSQDSIFGRGGAMLPAGPGDRIITPALLADGWRTAPAVPEIPNFDPVASAFVPEPGAAIAVLSGFLAGSFARRHRRVTC